MTAVTVQFPRQMKRGPKVRRGPCAQILHFPAPLTGDALHAEWFWLRDVCDRWDHEDLPTDTDLAAFDKEKFERSMLTIGVVRMALGKAEITDSEMRQDITNWRAKIEKRAQVKDWLDELGVDWKHAFNPELALFFAFDRLTACELPTSA